MNRRIIALALCAMALLVLMGCGGAQKSAQQKEGVVYLDPNATRAPAAQTAAPAAQGEADAPAEESAVPVETEAPAQEAAPDEGPEAAPDLYFENKGVRMEPWMEAAPILAALGDPIGSFEADSCAYIGKDLFYYYPGFELTVNEVEGVDRITAITLADDTVTIPQGLRIYDEEEKLLDILGGTEENGVYAYENGLVLLLIQVKDAGGDERRISSMEYRVAEDVPHP